VLAQALGGKTIETSSREYVVAPPHACGGANFFKQEPWTTLFVAHRSQLLLGDINRALQSVVCPMPSVPVVDGSQIQSTMACCIGWMIHCHHAH
jgi:hypothetical protein